MLVAGDAFDSNQVHDRTIFQTLEALKAFPGTWVFLPGNHDAALAHGVWTRMRQMGLPDNVVIADQPAPILLWGDRVAVLPAPLRRHREALDQTEWFDGAPTPGGRRPGRSGARQHRGAAARQGGIRAISSRPSAPSAPA